MKRKFAWIGFPFLFGLLSFSVGWGKYNLLFICFAMFFCIAGAFCLKKNRVCILTACIAFLSAMSYASVYTYAIYNRITEYSGKTVTVKGYVDDYFYTGSDKGRLTVKGKIDNGKTATITFFVPDDNFEYYDEIDVAGEVSAITDSVDFQSEKYNRPKAVYLKGNSVDSVVLTGKNCHPVLKAIKNYRDYMFYKINSIVGGDEGGFLSAMLCGDKSELSDGTKQMLYRTGIGHIFSVSGIHIVIISTFFGFFLKLFPISRKIKFLVMQIVIWGFAVFAGLSPSVVRASIMMTVILAADVTNRHGDCLNSLGLCCILLTLNNPYTVRDPSFLLSLSGAFALGTVAPKVKKFVKIQGVFGEFLKSMLVMVTFMLVTLPVTMLFFDEISLAAPVSNIILVPICTVALCVTILVVITGGAQFAAVPVLRFAGALIKIVLYLSEKISSVNYSYITVGDKRLKIVFICISLAGLFVIFLTKTYFKRLVFAVALYCAFVSVFNLNRVLHKDETHVVLIRDKNCCQVMIYNDINGVVFDANAKSKHNNALQRLAEKYGVSDAQAVLITNECYYTAMQYKTDFLPFPNKIVGDFEDDDCGELLSNDEYYDFDNLSVRRSSRGFLVKVDNTDILISPKRFYAEGVEYNNDGYPLDFVLTDSGVEVRRLDYGFDEQ